MSQVKVQHGTVTVTIEPVIDSAVINETTDGTLVSRSLDVRYEPQDLYTAVGMALRAIAPAPLEEDGGTP